jgi:uncharacterized protein (UPF0332 family)
LSLSADLLGQARALAGNEPQRPRQASLRRAVSAAYYSLFHLLTEDAALVMFGGSNAADLRAVLRHAFQHATMKNAAQGIGAGNPAAAWRRLLAAPSPELKFVAVTFVDLQQARHQADYDPGHRLTRSEAVDLVERAEAATAAWKAIRKTQPGARAYSLEARAFLAALLVHDQVARR